MICDIYKDVCLSTNGIVTSLVIAYGRQLLSSPVIGSLGLSDNVTRFDAAWSHSKGEFRGNANAYMIVWLYKLESNGGFWDGEKIQFSPDHKTAKSANATNGFFSYILGMNEEQRDGFLYSLQNQSDRNMLVADNAKPTAEHLEIERSAQSFLAAYCGRMIKAWGPLEVCPSKQDEQPAEDAGAEQESNTLSAI